MWLGYNTNGFAEHDIGDVLTVLSDIGYQSAALTLERRHLDPPDDRGVGPCIELLKPMIEAAGLRVTIETGSRFILDPRRKHQPTLLSASRGDRERRIEFLKAAVSVAAGLGAESVSLWSGAPDDKANDAVLFDRLTAGLREVLDHAEDAGVRLAFEPEPGMLIETMAQFERLHHALDHDLFGLTLDIGHVHCLRDGTIAVHARRWRDKLFNVHVEDMRRGRHEHLTFGDGEMDFGAVFEALAAIGYAGPVHVELPRHSHNAVVVAQQAYRFLLPFMQRGPGEPKLGGGASCPSTT